MQCINTMSATPVTPPYALRSCLPAFMRSCLPALMRSCIHAMQAQEELLKPLPPSRLLTWLQEAPREPGLAYTAAGCLAALAHHPRWLAELTATPTATNRVSSSSSSGCSSNDRHSSSSGVPPCLRWSLRVGGYHACGGQKDWLSDHAAVSQ